MAEICVALDYIVNVFRYPLEAKGINLEGIPDNLREIVELHADIYPLDKKATVKYGTSCTLAQTAVVGAMYCWCVSYCLAYLL
jgi:hypothetical protein